ncbi:hypothetical protein TCAL_08914 [Tigriopus californicus]|uniref:peptidylprolyl isomerase n=1 Tax=Tigriopus californicus TaxID=6832 RepID=A0A553NXR9_TIGCA|nr:uncharacterized protein LOC131886486 [Tigriopus californicus]TRY70232.1 hypothetical protein TCAL_08914 [Tigriopus californicus]|eukprot:TCALIF_08914-PA protein Name:"Similar to FKBP70 70 kDa peptidyl-prolyl isomerase (Triticum aestivum)" AED:0.23 eAED:0.23 QI:0/-1/0/1/-1/1/1/0/404
MANSALTMDLQGLNLDDLSHPQNQGAIPKVSPTLQKEPTKDEGSTNSKKRRSRRQKKKKVSEPNPVDDGPCEKEDNTGASSLEDRVPDFSFPTIVTSFIEKELEEEELLEAYNDTKDTSVPNNAPRKIDSEKRAGARRKRSGVGKRKKPKSPPLDGLDPKCSDDKENENLEMPDIKLDSDDSDRDDERPSGQKFHWKSVTKNGWIKKCILVDGLQDSGRPKPGDTVLVKSQGKLKDGTIIDDYPTQVFNVGEHEVVEGLDLVVQSMFKNELSIVSLKPEMAYGTLGRKGDVPTNSRITYLMGLLHFEKQKEISQLTWAQRRKSGQTRMRLANWWYQRKEYPIAVKCYKKALEYYNNIPTNQECTTPEEYKELLQLMEERLRVMRQVANIFKRIANMIQSGQITA